MSKRLVLLSVVGDDRPGIVERVTRVVVERSGNVEQSRSARLAGQFAGFYVVAVAEAQVDALKRGLEALATDGLTVSLRTAAERSRAAEGYVPHQLEVRGADHEGIIHDLCALLAEKAVNISEMATDVRPSPETGTPMFAMDAVLEVPPAVPARELRKWLNDVADKLSVDVSLKVQG
jgi:glycine cleavage system transcriptional repressor